MSETITGRELSKFPRPVVKVLTEAINKHQVKHRILSDGVHLRLYCGDRDVVPIKVAASRPAEHTLRYLLPWLEENVESWSRREVTEDTVKDLAEALNTSPKAAPEPVVERKEPTPGWESASHGFETNGKKVRCTVCGFEREGTSKQGLHLHSMKHTNPEAIKERARSAGENRSLRRKQAVTMRREAVRVLAKQNGLIVIEKDQAGDLKEVERLRKEIESLNHKVEVLTEQRDDLRARLDLMKEALRA